MSTKVSDHLSLDFQDGKGKYKFGGHAWGPLPVLESTFVILHDNVVDRVNSDCVGGAPVATVTEAPNELKGLQATD